MTAEALEANLRAYRALSEEWRDHIAQVEIDLYGTVPDPIFGAHVRKVGIERNPELWAKLGEVAGDLDVQKMQLEVRVVEAHEWMRGLREGATQS